MMGFVKAAKMAWKGLLSNFNLLHQPYKLTFAVTYHCTYKCVHCSIWKKKPINELKLDEIQEFAHKSNFFSWLNITGGEPFLRKDISDIIQAFYENSRGLYLLNLTTNGFNSDLIAQKMAEIVQYKIPRVVLTISLDGDEKKHEEIRGAPNSYMRVIELFKSIRRMKKDYKNLDTYFGYTSTPSNVGEFEKTYLAVKQLVPDITPRDIHVNLFHYSSHYYDNINGSERISPLYIQKTAEELQEMIRLRGPGGLNLLNFLENRYLKRGIKYVKTKSTPLSCKALQASSFLDSCGNIFPCIIYDNCVGNIRDYDYDLKKLLSSSNTKKMQNELGRLSCPNCWTPCEAYQMILGNLFSIS